MRRRSRPTLPSPSRALRVLLAVLALAAAMALPAGAQDQPPAEQWVLIQMPDGLAEHRVPWSSLAGLAKEVKVDLPGAENTSVQAVTLEQVLNRIQRTSDQISSIGLTRSDGAPMTITRLQLTRYYDDPLLYLDADGVLSLLRPKLIESPAEVARAIDGTLTLRVGSQPTLTAHPEVVAVNQTTSLEVTVPLDIPDRSKITYIWDFNDDKPVSRLRTGALHRSFTKPGTYNVIVSYEVDGQLWEGLAPSVAVTVKAAPKQNRDKNARKSDRRRARDDEQGGGGDEEETENPGAGPGSGIGDDGGDGTGGAGGLNTGGWDTPDAAAPPPPPAPRAQPRKQPRRAAPPPEPAGETVDGYLLAAADVPLPTGGAVRATVADPEPLDDEGPLNIPTAVWVVLGVIGLGLLGWTLESRTTLPYFKP